MKRCGMGIVVVVVVMAEEEVKAMEKKLQRA
jgi:hypothetical protein